MIFNEKPDINFLMHYGRGHKDGGHSGRYPWGSGEDPHQHIEAKDFLSRVAELRKANFEYIDEKGNKYTGNTAIAKYLKMSRTEFEAWNAQARTEERTKLYNRIASLAENGMGATEIGRKLGMNESSVRSILNDEAKNRMLKSQATADMLKAKLADLQAEDPKAMLDVGPGAEFDLNVTRYKLNEAIEILKQDGYVNLGGRIPQVTDPSGKHQTTLNVLAPPGTEKGAQYDYEHIYPVDGVITRDDGVTYEQKFHYPASMDSSRLAIRYAEDGGINKDGVIELRRGVPDLSLGNSVYSQVRILVDGNRYLKGMAVYSDNLPDGIDVLFNTNKTKDVAKMDVLKKIKDDPENPFGSAIKDANKGGQYWYIDANGEKKLGLINKRADEGDWSEWKDKVPSQFLSKQSLQLAEQQLGIAVQNAKDNYAEIMTLTNPTVKKYMLEDFARSCDSNAVSLQAAAFPRQKYQVILPIESMKDNEVFAPNYQNGEKVALIRYPHGGTFEIPILTVNNKKQEAIDILGTNTKDAVGINANVASRLSGADFDGDTVMVIPLSKTVNITSTKELPGLKGFDPKVEYATTEVLKKDTRNYAKAVEMRESGASNSEIARELKIKAKDVDSYIKNGEPCYYNKYGEQVQIMRNTQNEMGRISNLITDMTLLGAANGANAEELARAVRHSMVVIDAEKHKLDYKSSYQDNKIAELKETYQTGGASTLISRAKGETQITKTQGTPKVNLKDKPWYDPEKPEGSLIRTDSVNADYMAIKLPGMSKAVTVYERDGKYVYNQSKDPKVKDYVEVKDPSKILYKTRTESITNMENTNDARTLMSEARTPMEKAYAKFANTMKDMANKARVESASIKPNKKDPEASRTYASEVESLKTKLLVAQKNAPKERQAQILATSKINAQKSSNPNMTSEEEKKLRQRALITARDEVGAKRQSISITDREWEAIQAGAVSANTLQSILTHTDADAVKERATPKEAKAMNGVKVTRIKSYANQGYTNAQIAQMMGISASTVGKYLNE